MVIFLIFFIFVNKYKSKKHAQYMCTLAWGRNNEVSWLIMVEPLLVWPVSLDDHSSLTTKPFPKGGLQRQALL